MPSLRCLLLASSVLVVARHAAADPSSAAHRELRLSWVRSASAASCPDAGRVQADVERRLGWSPFIRSTGSSESIEASVTRDNEVWQAAIELRAADGTSLGSRDVESPAGTCASLAAAAGLAIALMIEPLLPAEPPPVPTVPPPPAKPPPIAATPPAVDSAPAPGSAPRAEHANFEQSLSLGVVGLVRVLPRSSLGPTLVGSVRLVDRLYLVASGSLFSEQHVRTGSADVGFGLTLATVGGCYRMPIADSWSISGCAALLAGSMQVIVSNPVPVDPGSRLWWAASAGLRLGWCSGRFEAALGIDALGHFKRQSYLIDRNEPSNSASSFVEPGAAAAGSFVAGVHY
jgi:hypothetical protein